MLATLLICAVTLGSVDNDAVSYDKNEEVTYSETASNRKGLWEYKRSSRIGYETFTFQNENGSVMPTSFGVGISRVRKIWLHKEPIAGIMKFAIDRGIDLNYARFATQIAEEDNSYNGPSGFVGSIIEDTTGEDIEESIDLGGLEGLDFNLADLGLNYFSIGYAVGASLTINPVSKLNVNTYCHFVPSVGLMFSGSSVNAGYVPYVRYGAELSFGRIGLGAEYMTGVSKMTDMLPMIMSKLESGDQETASTTAVTQKYYPNFMKVYLVLHMGKKKNKK